MHALTSPRRAKKRTLAGLLILALLAGCSNDAANGELPADGSSNPANVTISWHGNFGDAIDPNGVIERALEQRFQVNIDYVNAGNEKLSLLAASNDLPDVLRLPDPDDVTDYAKAGLLLELPEAYLAKKTPAIVQAIEKIGPSLWGLSSYERRNYAIPQAVQYVTWDTAIKWRADLLSLAGIARVPQTVAEYDAAFQAISAHGPEIIAATNPKLTNLYMFSGTDMSSAWNQLTWLFGAYGSMPGTWQLNAAGSVVRGELLPGTRDALLKLRDWYAKGYIDPAFVTDKADQFQAKWERGEYVLNGASSFIGDAAASGGSEPANPSDARLALTVPTAKFAWAKSPVGPSGAQGVFAWGQRQNFFAVSSRLKDQPEKLDKVLEMIETIASDEKLWLLSAYGVEGVSYAFDASGKPVLKPPYDDRKTAQTMAMGALGPAASPFAPFASLAITNRFADRGVADVWKRLNTDKPDVLFGLPLPSSQEMEQRNQEKWTETMIQVVTGTKPISFYDDYAAWFNDNGGPAWTAEANQLYKERFQGK